MCFSRNSRYSCVAIGNIEKQKKYERGEKKNLLNIFLKTVEISEKYVIIKFSIFKLPSTRS